MYDRRFFQSKLGQAAIASIAAMVTFVALSTQMQVPTDLATATTIDAVMIEIA
ncbi:MAG: hypothetical protein AAGK02_00630 [Pseudomonadota bacterium]